MQANKLQMSLNKTWFRKSYSQLITISLFQNSIKKKDNEGFSLTDFGGKMGILTFFYSISNFY